MHTCVLVISFQVSTSPTCNDINRLVGWTTVQNLWTSISATAPQFGSMMIIVHFGQKMNQVRTGHGLARTFKNGDGKENRINALCIVTQQQAIQPLYEVLSMLL